MFAFPDPKSFARALIVLGAATLSCACVRDPAPTPDQVLQAGPGRHWYRGNLHAHTLWSDGDAFPEQVVGRYRDAGYDFLALTDHNETGSDERWLDVARVPEGAALPPDARRRRRADGEEIRLSGQSELIDRLSVPGRFLLLPGEEISDAVGPVSVHVNAFGMGAMVPPARKSDVGSSIEADFAAAAEHGAGLAQLNHPNFLDAIPAEVLMRMRGGNLFEAFNAHPLSNNAGDALHPSVERLWDIALAWRLDVLGLPPLYGTATDDSHNYRAAGDARPGRAWVEVMADRLDPPSLFDALRRGRFYASSGVRLKKIVATPDRLEVEVDAQPGVDYEIEFVGTRAGFDTRSEAPVSATGRPVYASHRYSDDIGRVFLRVKGDKGVYRFRKDDLYVRARVVSSRRHPDPSQSLQYETAWVQPNVGPAGAAPSRKGVIAPPPPDPGLRLGVTHRFQPSTAAEVGPLVAAAAIDCSLDMVADGRGRPAQAVARAGGVTFGGWLADTKAGIAPDWLAVLLDGDADYVAEGGSGRMRPDVAKAFGKEALEAAGFHHAFELGGVAEGEYRIRLIGFVDGRARGCDTGRTLRVSP